MKIIVTWKNKFDAMNHMPVVCVEYESTEAFRFAFQNEMEKMVKQILLFRESNGKMKLVQEFFIGGGRFSCFEHMCNLKVEMPHIYPLEQWFDQRMSDEAEMMDANR